MTETPETATEVTERCWACNHPTDAHDVDPETGYRPCRSIGHSKGVPCAECRRLTSPEHVAAIMAVREGDSPEFKAAYGAFTVTYDHVRQQFGDAWKAFFTDIHESAVASALIEYEAAHEAMVRAKVAEEIVGRHLPLMPFPDREYVRGLMDAAAIARGDLP